MFLRCGFGIIQYVKKLCRSPWRDLDLNLTPSCPNARNTWCHLPQPARSAPPSPPRQTHPRLAVHPLARRRQHRHLSPKATKRGRSAAPARGSIASTPSKSSARRWTRTAWSSSEPEPRPVCLPSRPHALWYRCLRSCSSAAPWERRRPAP